MDHHQKEKIARLVKESRLGKGYTQQELSDISGISLRSVQRIENAEVLPRMFTLKLLSQHLGFPPEMPAENDPSSREMPIQPSGPGTAPLHAPAFRGMNRQQKSILTAGAGIVLALLLMAFMAQSSTFPETDFELFLALAGTACCYMITLLIIWK